MILLLFIFKFDDMHEYDGCIINELQQTKNKLIKYNNLIYI